MKILKRIIVWTLIPVIFELAGLFFIDRFYMGDEMNFSIKKVDISSKKNHTKIKVKVPEDAEDIKVSHNGNYISYCEGESIYVIDTDKDDKKEVTMEDGSELSYYRWDLDSDVILMAEKFSRAGSSYLKFVAYDAKRDSTTERKNDSNQVLEILLPDSDYEVKKITFSGASNVTYVTSGAEGQTSRIYRINRMTQMNLVRFGGIQLGNIAAINNQDGDQIVYEDRSTNRIRIGRSQEVIATGENGLHYLLDTDNNDRIYIGNGENNRISKIFVADLTQPRSSWKTYQLSSACDKKNIYVVRDGRIYINDPGKNTVTELTTGKSVHYDGYLVGVYNYGVVSRDGNKILGSLFE
ncbi:MAG: hypothetical protein LKE46_10265 [Clostridium sp.]|jgi:hypothetical protein|uniref:hypothetical protein n=1 Tax=Clostridium sp. TaxID=1506 RepID=UPI0025C365A0|nr:hypothetical protein [Clostridium sp.]MCH3964646.1 hypothetical protein [Clostridium sp.]MCI1715117.1 hypothetical protein [Clostridium sp.]MCI1799379.1 hypothetical protein [Clostridium sp.]MCI1813300.1 hypothetical protein [Clostridium sp.]MCI1870191.1 hypothetical protein [Clostridium sp.]